MIEWNYIPEKGMWLVSDVRHFESASYEASQYLPIEAVSLDEDGRPILPAGVHAQMDAAFKKILTDKGDA